MSQLLLAENPDSCSYTVTHQATERRCYREESRGGKEGTEGTGGRVGVREERDKQRGSKRPKKE